MYDTQEKKQVVINWLWKVALGDDGKIDADEKSVIDGVAKMLQLDAVEFTNAFDASLDKRESVYLLRELYRISASNRSFTDSQKKIIEEFAGQYGIGEEALGRARKWLDAYLENEREYMDFADGIH